MKKYESTDKETNVGLKWDSTDPDFVLYYTDLSVTLEIKIERWTLAMFQLDCSFNKPMTTYSTYGILISCHRKLAKCQVMMELRQKILKLHDNVINLKNHVYVSKN